MITNHTQLLNYLASKYELQAYLEIGVQNPNNNFDKINCRYKIGCDPDVTNDVRIYEGTSDQYFIGYGQEGDKTMLDLIFIDGLHHSDQVKRDFENSLRCLTDNGFILIHDTMPDDESTTHVPRDSKMWHGDVYKFAMTLNTYDDIGFITFPIDCGCTLVWKIPGKKGLPQVHIMDWHTYKKIGNVLLNVVPVKEIETLLPDVKRTYI